MPCAILGGGMRSHTVRESTHRGRCGLPWADSTNVIVFPCPCCGRWSSPKMQVSRQAAAPGGAGNHVDALFRQRVRG